MRFHSHSLTEDVYAAHRAQFPMIDVTKFFCALLIVAIHTNPLESISPMLNHVLVNYLARMAVPFFFIASGYFLYKKTSYENFDFGITWKFVKRILSLYVLWSAIYFVPAMTDYLRGGMKPMEALLEWLRNFVFVGSYMQLWYLNALALAVLLVSFCIKKRMKVNHILVISGLLYLIGLLWQSYHVILQMLEGTIVWNFSEMLRSVISTTRNGLFEGFFFVAIGMYFAYKPIKIKQMPATIGLGVSLVVLLAEVLVVSKLDWALGTDMYLFLAPAAFFIFYMASHIELTDKKIYVKLRDMSTLIFYLHTLVLWFLPETLKANSLVRYVLVVLITGGIALLISGCSGKIKWLRKLY